MAEQEKAPIKSPKKKNPTTVSGPRLIGYYSVDGDRSFLPDSSQLRYFNPPKDGYVNFDLNEGIETAVRSDEKFKAEGIDHLLEWLKLNHKELRAAPTDGRPLKPKFICTRGILTRILKTPRVLNDRWIIYATKLKGSIYLCGDKTMKAPFETTAINEKYESWGCKFEQCVLSDSPDTASDTSKPVLESAEFRCVYQCRIGNHPVLYSAVMKGVCSEEILKDPLPLHRLKFIETKTSKITEYVGSLCIYKFLNWWSQCFLTNTPAVLCGFRDQNGIVQSLKRYEVTEMIEMAKPYWNPTDCIDFCESFLTKVSKTMANGSDLAVWSFERKSKSIIETRKLPTEVQYGFIPQGFVEALG